METGHGKYWIHISPPDHFPSYFASKMRPKNHQKNDGEKHMKLTPKGSKNGAEIDAKTHHESMPRLVTKEISKIIKHHVSLKGKIIQIHCKNNGFECLAGCARERKRY